MQITSHIHHYHFIGSPGLLLFSILVIWFQTRLLQVSGSVFGTGRALLSTNSDGPEELIAAGHPGGQNYKGVLKVTKQIHRYFSNSVIIKWRENILYRVHKQLITGNWVNITEEKQLCTRLIFYTLFLKNQSCLRGNTDTGGHLF